MENVTGFRYVDIGKMEYETLRGYYSVNSSGKISVLYKYIACLLAPLQNPFNAFDTQRQIQWLVAQCAWEIGQLTNVLNFLFDPSLKRIFITQSVSDPVSAVTFAYPAITQAFVFNEISTASGNLQMRVFGEVSRSILTINVPVSVNIPAITAIIEQIRLQGIPYRIVIF